MKEARCHFGIDIACRLIRDKQVWPINHRAGDRDALLFSARERWRAGTCSISKTDPCEHFTYRTFDVRVARARDPQR